MKSRKLSAALVAACITAATPFMALPALGAACLETPATQTLGGLVNFNLVGGGTSTTCTAGNMTFSNVVVNTPIADQGGSVVLGDFIPVSPAPGFAGLELNYTGIAPNVQNATVEVSWTYNVNVSAPLLITQAFLGLHDTGVGGGQSTAIETLSNGITLRLDTPGSIILNADDASSLFVQMDQIDSVGGTTSKALSGTNAFTTLPVPGPVAGAGLPGMITILGGTGLLGWWRRRQKLA
jgi:hypothetical protein